MPILKKKIKTLKTDVLIIGGGTSGLYLADRLKKLNKDIILIERGGKVANIKKNKSKHNTLPKHTGFEKNTSIGLGGNSTLWGGQLVEFDREDFNNKSFPGISYSEIKKYYQLVYKRLNVNYINQDSFLKKTKQKKIKNKNLVNFYTHWLNEPNFKKFFINDIKENDYKILLNSEILKLNFENKKCNYALVKSKDVIRKIYSKVVIFCCGTFNNNQLLFDQKTNSPWEKNHNLGKFFQDHIGLFIGKIKILDKQKFYNIFLNGFISNSKYQPKIKSRYVINNFNYGISGEIKTKSESFFKNLNNLFKKFFINKNLFNLINLIKVLLNKDYFWIGAKRSLYFLLHKKLLYPNNNELYFYIQCEQKVNAKSKIFLPSKNKKVDLKWSLNGDEFLVIKKFITDVSKYYEKENIFKIDTKDFYKLNYQNFIKNLRDTNHSSGGLIISKNKKNGVVDKNLKIWNTKNLYITGPSVLPKTSHANITLTSLAFTERLAYHLTKKLY